MPEYKAKENAEFVCAMEDVLDVYKRSYDETHPLTAWTKVASNILKKHACRYRQNREQSKKYDTEYERNGMSNMFMFFDLLEGKSI